MQSFIYGYLAAHECSKDSEKCNVCQFREFDDWVKCRLHSEKYGVSWRHLLLERFDEKNALNKCFEFISEFKIRKFSLIAELIDIKLASRSVNGNEEKETIYTTTVLLGKYTQDPGYWVRIKGQGKSRLSGFYYDIKFFESLIGISREDWIIREDDKL